MYNSADFLDNQTVDRAEYTELVQQLARAKDHCNASKQKEKPTDASNTHATTTLMQALLNRIQRFKLLYV